MWRKQKYFVNKNLKPLTVHNKEKQINLKMCKLIYIRCFFVVVYLFIQNTGRAHILIPHKVFANLYSDKPNESDNFKTLNV